MVMELSASNRGAQIFAQDFTQAYTQSTYNLELNVYIKPPTEMDLPGNKKLIVITTLYGFPEAGLHCYLT